MKELYAFAVDKSTKTNKNIIFLKKFCLFDCIAVFYMLLLMKRREMWDYLKRKKKL